MSLFSAELGNPATQSPSSVPATTTDKQGNSAFGADGEPKTNPYDINDSKATKKISDRIEERYRKANNRRWLFELSWLRNVLYQLGVQWVRVDWPGREVRNLALPGNFPRAITNTYAKVNSDLMSAITQGDIPLNPAPSTDDPDDIGTANVASRVREVIDEEAGTRSLKRDLGFWLTLTGNAFLDIYYDYNPKYGTKAVPQYTCTQCQAQTLDAAQPCAACGGPQPPPPQVDETGAPVPLPPLPPPFIQSGIQNVPIGKLCYDSLSPYEVYWDNTVRLGCGKHHWVLRPHRYDVGDAKALWPTFAEKISEDMNEPMKVSRNYLVAIAYAGSYLSGVTGSGEASARENNRKQVTAWVYRELPSPDYPEGVRAVQLGDLIVELGPLDTQYSAGQAKGEKFISLVHFFGEVSGGAWGKPRANDLCTIQARRNIIASNLQLTAQRTGGPKLLLPIGCGFKNAAGEAGQTVEYKPVSFGGSSMAEPHYLEAALGNVQPLVLLIKQLDEEMESIAGTHFVTGADVPPGVTAASALSYLGEKANQSITPLKEVWVESWRTAYKYGIELARQHWTDERILAILGTNKEWQFMKFKAADLKGAVDMRIDYDAMFPKSQATERANIMALVQMGAVQPAMDPEQRAAVLEAFGESRLKESDEGATAQAIREWDAFLNDNVPPVLLPLVQDVALHLAQHKRDAQSQEFENLYRTDQPKADLWIAHIQATTMELIAASMPMAPDGAPSPVAPGGPAGSKTPPGHPGSQHGSQAGAAGGNLQHGEPAPVRKGQQAADAGPGPAPISGPPAG